MSSISLPKISKSSLPENRNSRNTLPTGSPSPSGNKNNTLLNIRCNNALIIDKETVNISDTSHRNNLDTGINIENFQKMNAESPKNLDRVDSIDLGADNIGIGRGVGIPGRTGTGGGVIKKGKELGDLKYEETKPTTTYTGSTKSAIFSKINEEQEEEKIMEQEMTDNVRINNQILKQDVSHLKNNSSNNEVAIPEVLV